MAEEICYLQSCSDANKQLLLDQDSVLLGRCSEAKHIIKNLLVSRFHALLRRLDTDWVIEDLKSFNGVFVNDSKIRRNVLHRLTIGDKIGLGVPVDQYNNDGNADLVYQLCRRERSREELEQLPPPPAVKLEPSSSSDEDNSMSDQTICRVQRRSTGSPQPGPQPPVDVVAATKEMSIVLEKCDSSCYVLPSGVTVAPKDKSVEVPQEVPVPPPAPVISVNSDSDSDLPQEERSVVKRRLKKTPKRPVQTPTPPAVPVPPVEVIDLCDSDSDQQQEPPPPPPVPEAGGGKDDDVFASYSQEDVIVVSDDDDDDDHESSDGSFGKFFRTIDALDVVVKKEEVAVDDDDEDWAAVKEDIKREFEVLVSQGPADDDRKQAVDTTDFFPVLSQDFDDSEPDDDHHHQEEEEEEEEEELEPQPSTSYEEPPPPVKVKRVAHEKINRAVDRLKTSSKDRSSLGPELTEPRPMFYGRRLRSLPQSRPCPPAPPASSPTKVTKIIAPRRVSSRFSAKGKKQTLKNRVLQHCGQRLRVPGGGSDVRPPPAPAAPPTPAAARNVPGSKPVAAAAATTTGSSSSNQRKTSKVPQQESRNERLFQDMLEGAATTTTTEGRRALPAKRKATTTPKIPPKSKKKAPEVPLATETKEAPEVPSTSTAATAAKRKAIMLDTTVATAPKKSPAVVAPPAPQPPNRKSEEGDGCKATPGKKVVTFSDNLVSMRLIEPRPPPEVRAPQRPRSPPSRHTVGGFTFQALTALVSWNPMWLDQQEKLGAKVGPPPLVDHDRMCATKKSYDSYEDYASTFQPFVLLETWEDMSQAWRERRGRQVDYPLVCSGVETHVDGRSTVKVLTFHGIVPKKEQEHDDERTDYPTDGWLTILKVPARGDCKQAHLKLFAYVRSSTRSSYDSFRRSGFIPPLLEEFARQYKGDKSVLTTHLMTKASVPDFHLNIPCKVMMLLKIRQNLQLLECVGSLEEFPLGASLLKPTDQLCRLPGAAEDQAIVAENQMAYNDSQRLAITSVAQACLADPGTPSVSLVLGPPGTGKTTVIAALVIQLLLGENVADGERPVVLLCAPSNNAVDENVQRLLEYRETLRGRKGQLRIVRLGQADRVHRRVRSIHVDHLIRRNFSNDGGNVDGLVRDMERLAADISRNRTTLGDMTRRRQVGQAGKLRHHIAEMEKRLGDMEMQLDKSRQMQASSWTDNRSKLFEMQREKILLKANVIATTLGSSFQGGMDIFHAASRPPICIVDEATQCVEPEVLLPLQFGVRKLVLVGDPHQLSATVLSRKAQDKGYKLSLFERLYEALGGAMSPAIMLDVQYRMHPDICRFPSLTFYKNKLRTGPGVEASTSATRFLPYVFFNVVDSLESTKGAHELLNVTEATFVCRLCRALATMDPSLDIGVITFYNAQKQLIADTLRKLQEQDEDDEVEDGEVEAAAPKKVIEVNTVDGFQGREKDVIVVSAVRANDTGTVGFIGDKRRLNVALTRGRKLLYICGHAKSLRVSGYWKDLVRDAVARHRFLFVTSATADLLPLITKK